MSNHPSRRRSRVQPGHRVRAGHRGRDDSNDLLRIELTEKGKAMFRASPGERFTPMPHGLHRIVPPGPPFLAWMDLAGFCGPDGCHTADPVVIVAESWHQPDPGRLHQARAGRDDPGGDRRPDGGVRRARAAIGWQLPVADLAELRPYIEAAGHTPHPEGGWISAGQ